MKTILQFWRTLTVLIIIFILCLIPAKDIQKIDFLKISYEDLAVHLAMFSSFSFLLYRDLMNHASLDLKPGRIAWIVFFCGLFLGVFTEFLQFIFIRLQRTANPVDLTFDVLGTGIGILATRLIKPRSDSAQ
jgi:hypothetical protein